MKGNYVDYCQIFSYPESFYVSDEESQPIQSYDCNEGVSLSFNDMDTYTVLYSYGAIRNHNTGHRRNINMIRIKYDPEDKLATLFDEGGCQGFTRALSTNSDV